MKKFLFLLLFVQCAISNLAIGQFVLDQSSAGNTSILIDVKSNPTIQRAATELQKYIKKSIGITLPIETKTKNSNRIIIGSPAYIQSVNQAIKVPQLDYDSYVIITNGNDLALAGGVRNGPLYAVYTFLDEYVGLKLLAPDAMVIPKIKRLPLPAINLVETPSLILRDVVYRPAIDTLYGYWHKLAYATYLQPLYGNFAHTGFQIMPPSQYFKDHPEYYSLVNGKRQPYQLDYSNKDVQRIVTGWLNAQILAKPQYQYWTLGIEDNKFYCQCPDCKRIIDSTGTPGGPVIVFANYLAKFFWKKNISTLAYSFVSPPPTQNIKLNSNLNIIYCAKAKNFPGLYTSNTYAEMENELSGWERLTKNIFIWDYVIDFGALESVFANLKNLKPNLNYFIRKGIKGYYAQGNYFPKGEFAELRTYLLAKLVVHPDLDDNKLIDEFLNGFYGPAAPTLKKYIQLTSSQLSGAPNMMTIDMAKNYTALFDEAEKSVMHDTLYLKRVQKEKMCLDYSAVQCYLRTAKEKPDIFFKNNDNVTTYRKHLEDFLNSLVKFSIVRLVFAQNSAPMYQYYTQWKNQMDTLQIINLKKRK